MVQIEVCERLMDHQPDGSPKFHACVKGNLSIWDCGNTRSEAIGNLVKSHPEYFQINSIEDLGKQTR